MTPAELTAGGCGIAGGLGESLIRSFFIIQSVMPSDSIHPHRAASSSLLAQQ
jgi:hypothetical protein